MTIELLYTSASQGLKQGSRGFCTVVCTAGLPINLAQRLESLSGYRHIYQPGDDRHDSNPVCHSHIRLAVGGRTLSILSRVGAYGVDYSQRTNKIAHHVVFDGPVPACGPAAVLAQSGIMRNEWDGVCRTLQTGPEVSSIDAQPRICHAWKQVTGDAGWAGVIANAWMQPSSKTVWVVFSEAQSTELLELMQEAAALLPESRRWQATFSTYCTNLPPDVECRVRCVIAGSDEARMSVARGLVIDLTKPLGMAPASDAVEAARNGHLIGLAASTKPSPSGISSPPLDHPSQQEVSSSSSRPVGSEEFALQPISTHGPPIPVRRSKRAGGSRFQPNTGPSTVLSRYRNRIGIGIILVGLLSLIGAGTFYFMSQQNNLAGILDDSGSGVLLPNEDTQQKAQDTEPKSENIPEESTESTKREPEPKTESPLEKPADVKLRLHVRIEEILENAPVVSEVSRHVADVEIENGTPDILELIAGGEHFELVQSKLFLKQNETGFDFEKIQSLSAQLRAAEKVVDVKIPIKNIDEPNLKLAIKDSNQNYVSSVREGNKLFAHVENADPDENGSRQFEWEGLQEDGKWVVFSSGKNYTDDAKHLAKYLKVRCKLTYGSSIPSPSTVSYSEDVRVLKMGTARILLTELLMDNREDPPVIRIELPIDELPKLPGKSQYHAKIGEKEARVSENNQLITATIALDSNINNFNGFSMPSAFEFEGSNQWLQSVHFKVRNWSKWQSELHERMRNMTTKLSLALREFIERRNPSKGVPLDVLTDEFEEVHNWLKELIEYQNLQEDKELDSFEQVFNKSKNEPTSESGIEAKKVLEKLKKNQEYDRLLEGKNRRDLLLQRFGSTARLTAIAVPIRKYIEETTGKINPGDEIRNFLDDWKNAKPTKIKNPDNKNNDISSSFGLIKDGASELQAFIRNTTTEVVIDSKKLVVISIIEDRFNKEWSKVKQFIDLQVKVEVVGLESDPKNVPDLNIPSRRPIPQTVDAAKEAPE